MRPILVRYRLGRSPCWREPPASYGSGQDQKAKQEAALAALLYQEVGQLKAERDFLADWSGP